MRDNCLVPKLREKTVRYPNYEGKLLGIQIMRENSLLPKFKGKIVWYTNYENGCCYGYRQGIQHLVAPLHGEAY